MKVYRDIVVFGSHSHALHFLNSIEEIYPDQIRVRAFVDELENGFQHPLRDVPVISSETRKNEFGDCPVLLAVGSGQLRQRVATELEEEGVELVTYPGIGHPRVDRSLQIGAGSCIQPDARVGPNVKIGKGVQAFCSLLGHDIVIGDFTTLGIDSAVLGHVHIGANVHIAPRAVISSGSRQKPMIIGDGAFVGTGAVVTRNVDAGSKVIGNPAMPLMAWRKFMRPNGHESD